MIPTDTNDLIVEELSNGFDEGETIPEPAPEPTTEPASEPKPEPSTEPKPAEPTPEALEATRISKLNDELEKLSLQDYDREIESLRDKVKAKPLSQIMEENDLDVDEAQKLYDAARTERDSKIRDAIRLQQRDAREEVSLRRDFPELDKDSPQYNQALSEVVESFYKSSHRSERMDSDLGTAVAANSKYDLGKMVVEVYRSASQTAKAEGEREANTKNQSLTRSAEHNTNQAGTQDNTPSRPKSSMDKMMESFLEALN